MTDKGTATETLTFRDYTTARDASILPQHRAYWDAQVVAAEATLRSIGIDPAEDRFTDRQWMGRNGICERNGISI